MKKSVFQHIIESGVTLFGVASLASLVITISNATRLINYKSGIILTCIVIAIWWILTYRVEAGKLNWVSKKGKSAPLKQLGIKTELLFISLLLIVMAQTCLDFYKNGPFSQKQQLGEAPIFDPNEQSFKLLILPWHKECLYEGIVYDIGFVLKKRLEDLANTHRINLHVYCLEDSINLTNFNKDSAYALMRYHNADQVLYGSYSLSKCEGGSSDKICFNYQTDARKWNLEGMHSRDKYKMSKIPHGIEDIREGTGQEDIDYVIYWVAAMSEMSNRNPPRAVQFFEKIKDYENKEPVLFQLSNCYFYMKDYDRTKVLLEKVLKINPHHEEANVHLSGLLIREGKTEAAKERLEQMLNLNPENENVLRDLCLIHRTLKDTARSDMYFKKFLEFVPESADTYKMLGAMYKDLESYAKSKEYYEKAFTICSKHTDDWNNLGELYMLLGDSAKAKPYFIHALDLNNNSFTALYNMGVLLQREKQYASAGDYLQKAVTIEFYNENALAALGANYEAIQKNEEALKYYEKALAINPNIVKALINTAAIYMKLKQHDKANRYLDQLVNYFPDNVEILNVIGNLCINLENYDQAEVYYKRLLKLAPDTKLIEIPAQYKAIMAN